jgi:hypothetical protein
MKYRKVPLWLKVSYTLMVCVIVPVYWREYGPDNFLWFSDIALLVMVPALWMESRLLASMMGLAVLPLEIMWMIGFFSGGAFLTVADYMFDPALPLWLRALSLFHFPMPAAILFMLWQFGYDPRALPWQTGFAVIIMPLTYRLTEPEEGTNWVFRPEMLESAISQHAYLALLTLILITVVYLPTHRLLKRWFPIKGA